MGSITFEVVFGSPNNFRSEGLTFDIVPLHSSCHALLGRTTFARFNAVPHYAYQNQDSQTTRRYDGQRKHGALPPTEEHTAALAVEVRGGLIKQNINSAAKPPDTIKRVQTTRSMTVQLVRSSTSNSASVLVPTE